MTSQAVAENIPASHRRIIALAQAGADVTTIVDATGANLHTIRVLLRRAGLLQPHTRMDSEGLPVGLLSQPQPRQQGEEKEACPAEGETNPGCGSVQKLCRDCHRHGAQFDCRVKWRNWCLACSAPTS